MLTFVQSIMERIFKLRNWKDNEVRVGYNGTKKDDVPQPQKDVAPKDAHSHNQGEISHVALTVPRKVANPCAVFVKEVEYQTYPTCQMVPESIHGN